MADTISVTVELSGEVWTITGTVVAGDVLPANIFTYENTGTLTLGPYVGVCSLGELKRLQVFSESVIPKFGNRFVRSSQAKITVPLDVDTAVIVRNMIASAKLLKTELLAATSNTTVYPI